MNTPPPDPSEPHCQDDAAPAEFADLLRRVPLRPPPAAWRAEILEAAASGSSRKSAAPFAVNTRRLAPFRFPRLLTGSLAALWMLSLGMWLETRRLAPASSSSSSGGSVAAFAPASLQNEQFLQLLASLETSPSSRPSFLLHRSPP